jgi:hypothetical protein
MGGSTPPRRTEPGSLAGAGHQPGRAAGRPGHAGVRRLGRGHVCLFAGDLPHATAYFEDGLAVLPAAVRGRQRAQFLTSVVIAAGVAGDEERVLACHRELAALTEAGSDYIRRAYSAYSLWALGAAAWRRGDVDRAAELEQQSLRLLRDDRMGRTFCLEALAWIRRVAAAVRARRGPARRRHRLWQSMGTSLDSHQPMAGHHRDCERQARQGLGEAAFQAAYYRGLELPAADVLACSRRKSRRKSRRRRPSGLGRPCRPGSCRWPG